MLTNFRHLVGLKTLLTAVSAEQQEQLQVVPSITVGRQASFWNFARADYQAAYSNGQKTLLDTEDYQLWRDSGLQIQDDGSLYTNVDDIRNDALHCRAIAQLVSHSLLWLVLKVTNYCMVDRHNTSIRQSSWERLTEQLDSWYNTLPQTFQPCAQIRYPTPRRPHCKTNNNSIEKHAGQQAHFTELFFSIDQCAAALQLYHYARLLLLRNAPTTTTKKPCPQTLTHAREIVGIALGRPHPAVRVEMLLPLYLAGMCLEVHEERKVVLGLLRAIGEDTGCSSEVKVRSLREEWGWGQEP